MPTNQQMAWRRSLPAALLLLAPFNILASLAMDIYLPIVPAMPGILGTTPAVVQLSLTLYMIVLGVGQLVFGPLSDRFGRRPVLLCGALLFAAASLLMAWPMSATGFLGLRLLQAIGASAAMVAVFATVRDVYAGSPESAAVYGLLNGMLAFVPALGPVAGALIVVAFGWRGVFATLGVLALAAMLWIQPRWGETRPAAPAAGRHYARMLRSTAFQVYTLGFSAAMGAFFVYFSTAPRILIERAGYSELQFSLAFASAAAVMIAVARLAGTFAARWGVSGCLLRGMLTMLAGSALLVAGQLFFAPSFWSFVMPMWVVAVGIVLTASVTADGALDGFGETAGSAVALYYCVQSLCVGIVGTLCVVTLDGDTAWPLVAYTTVMSVATLAARTRL